jgi:hypothetical protein
MLSTQPAFAQLAGLWTQVVQQDAIWLSKLGWDPEAARKRTRNTDKLS